MAKEKVLINPEIENYTEKLSQNPTSRVFAPLADAYRKCGMLDEAINVCVKGLKLHPNYMSAHVVLGKIYLQKEMIEDAKREFEKVLEIDFDNLVALTMLGEISRRLNRFEDAIAKYEKILKLDPFNDNAKRSIEAIRVQSVSLNKQEEIFNVYQEEVEKEKTGLKVKPPIQKAKKWTSTEDTGINTLTMAELYFKQEMFYEAKKVCNKILVREPDNADVKKFLQKIIETEQRKIEPEKITPPPVSEKISLKTEDVSSRKIPILNTEPKVSTEIVKEIEKEIESIKLKREEIRDSEKKHEEKVLKEVKLEHVDEPKEQKKEKVQEEIKKSSHVQDSDSFSFFSDFIQAEVDEKAKSNKLPDKRISFSVEQNKDRHESKIKDTDGKASKTNPLEDWLDLIKEQK